MANTMSVVGAILKWVCVPLLGAGIAYVIVAPTTEPAKPLHFPNRTEAVGPPSKTDTAVATNAGVGPSSDPSSPVGLTGPDVEVEVKPDPKPQPRIRHKRPKPDPKKTDVKKPADPLTTPEDQIATPPPDKSDETDMGKGTDTGNDTETGTTGGNGNGN